MNCAVTCWKIGEKAAGGGRLTESLIGEPGDDQTKIDELYLEPMSGGRRRR